MVEVTQCRNGRFIMEILEYERLFLFQVENKCSRHCAIFIMFYITILCQMGRNVSQKVSAAQSNSCHYAW